MAEAPAEPAQVAVRGLRVAYGGVVALDGVDLDARAGQVLAVTGPSGAGKSTLLWALAGAARPAAGTVTVDGEPVADRDAAVARGVGIVPQGNGLATVLTARENVLLPLLATGVAADDAGRRTDAVLDAVGLGESGGHLVEELSGGQQQRVAVARGLAARSRVLLADEPTSELDHINRERVLALLRAEADRGAVVVMATHDPEAAEQADGEVRLDEGRLTVVRSPQ
ncbi:ABC transporter ATP-binding protein [Lapillicoccus jejuensis]|uniref:Putative ABC transport system ATP-binding protein n=1 Tax=Lapillicoccus jejuensis TaxID=402171 RepID=A0A542E604_9MICO|nr:ATP-binding cassette domain-containing protein [Lapillicoccus jejuensis]TQJ10775.1 putative ABC transport system ATP-binding protein [Lapillicoccus jejuensis]